MAVEYPFKLRPHRVLGAGKFCTIWGETDKLDRFLTGIEAASGGSTVDRSVTVKASSVRRYPGAPTFTRKSHQRIYTPDLGLKGGVTPGKAFWIEEEGFTDSIVELGRERFQFTVVGAFYVLKAHCKANAKVDFILRSPGGRAHLIEAGD